MYKAVLFDLDGTLLDTGEGVIKSVIYVIRKMGLPMLPENELNKFVGPPIRRKMQTVFDLSDSEAERAMNLFREHYGQEDIYLARPYEGIFEVLRILKKRNMKIAVATYKREDQAKKLLSKFGMNDLFDVIHGSDKDGILTKEDVVNKCINDLQVAPDEAVMIGDSDNDAIGAERAGLHFVGVTYGFGFKRKEDLEFFRYLGIAEECKDILLWIE